MPSTENEDQAIQHDVSMIMPLQSTKRHERYNLPVIIKREYMARVQSRSFQVVTVLLMLIIIIAASVPTILAVLTAKTQTQIAVINAAGDAGGLDDSKLLSYLNTHLNAEYNSSQQNNASTQSEHFALRMAAPGMFNTLRQQVYDNKLAILLQISRDSSGELTFVYYTNDPLSANTDLAQVQTVAAQLYTQDKLSRLGIEQSQFATLFTPPAFQAISTLQQQSGRSPAESNAAIAIGMLAIILLFLFIQQYCSMVSTGVAEEKGSRIMEILVNATTPFQLLLGKIVGIGLAGITQMGLVCLVGSAALLAQNPLKQALHVASGGGVTIDITAISFGMLALLVLYFVLGFLLYATLYAAAGALVSRQEEVSSSVGPLVFFIMISYVLSFYATLTPQASWIVPLSYVPFFTPMMMLAREAIMPLAWWEIALSSIVMVVAILLFAWFAAYIYRVGILMYGQKPGFGAFFRSLWSANKKAAA